MAPPGPGTATGMTRALLTTDGSPGSIQAAAAARRILGDDCELVLLHVVAPVPMTSATGRFATGAMEPAMLETTKEGQAVLQRAADALGVPAEQVLVEGDPATAICQTAEERDVDVIVVGARGLGPIRRALLGSVSTQVTSESDRPVLVVPTPEG
jgi:nucleotide-binding universal stress UspA family protein